MKFQNNLFFIAFLSTLLFFGCEKLSKDIIDINLDTPFIVSANVDKNFLHIQNDSLAIVDSNHFSKKIFAKTIVRNKLNTTSLKYEITKPNTNDIIQSGFLKYDSLNIFSDTINFIFHKNDVGVYYFHLTALNQNLQSNTILLSVSVSRNNSKPHIENINAPDSIQIPQSGFNLILFTTIVSDSNGISDINEVYFKNMSSQSQTSFYLYDDGNTQDNGDEMIGDGIFSRILRIDSTNTSGTKLFKFFAKDKSNTIDSIDKEIVIYN